MSSWHGNSRARPVHTAGLLLRLLGAGTALLTTSAFAQGLTATVSLLSDYDYHGVTQTANGPAIQPTVEFSAAPVHIQVWASNVSFSKPRRLFGSGHTEVAWTADLAGGVNKVLLYDVGVNYFTYPGIAPNADFGEIFATANLGWLSTSMHYSRNYDNLHPWLWAAYFEANGRWTIGSSKLNVLAHTGESWGPYWSYANQGPYLDYSIGAERQIRNIDLSLRFVGTSRYAEIPYGEPLSGKARIVASLSMTLP